MAVNPASNRLRKLAPQDEVSFIPMEAIGEYGGLQLDQSKPIRDLGASYTAFEDGDVIVAKITPCFENGKGALAGNLTNGVALGTTELHVLRPRAGLLPEFLFYVSISREFRGMGEGEMYGAGGQKRVPPEFCKNVLLPLPSLREQEAIASFLKRELAKLDALIEEQRRLTDLLKEKRQAVISHAVTKGLNTNAPMKPSGIEWLGDVPAHWPVLRLKWLCDIQTGSRDTEDAVDDGMYPFFVRSQSVERIDSMSFDCEAIFTAGDGAGVGKVFHHYTGAFDFHQRVYMMNNFRDVSGTYLYHYLRENFFKVALEGGAKSTVDSLRRPVFTSFPVCLPPRDEQDAIVRTVDAAALRMDALTAEARRAINLLQERRAALVSAAVTGQIDVRGLAPQEGAS